MQTISPCLYSAPLHLVESHEDEMVILYKCSCKTRTYRPLLLLVCSIKRERVTLLFILSLNFSLRNRMRCWIRLSVGMCVGFRSFFYLIIRMPSGSCSSPTLFVSKNAEFVRITVTIPNREFTYMGQTIKGTFNSPVLTPVRCVFSRWQSI